MTERLTRALDRAASARPIPGNAVRHLPNSGETLEIMLELIAGARRAVHFENYIVRDDHTGRRFAVAFKERAAAGVRVRVLYDAFGSSGTSRRFWRDLRRGGVEVRAFRPLLTSGVFEVLSRDHRKLLVVDGEEAVLGGLCIGNEWAGDPAKGRLPWRDTMVGVRGPAVGALAGTFARLWERTGEPLPKDERFPSPAAAGPTALRVIENIPTESRTYRVTQLIAAAAAERLWITDAYLVAPPPLYAALADAARAGVDVRLLLPGATDVPVARALSRTGYRELLRAGVRIFEYRGPMLHAKTLVADHEWTRIGSSNMNATSLIGNYELDVMAECDHLAEQLAAQFRHDAAFAQEIVLQDRRRLPARLVDAAAPVLPTPSHRPSGRERRARAVVAVVQVAGGARRLVAASAAVLFGAVGVFLLVFPTVATVVFAALSLGASAGLASYALARRRARRRTDDP